MQADQVKQSIIANAEEIRSLHARIEQTVRHRDRSPQDRRAWELACQTFHSRHDALAFPGGYQNALERIVAGDSSAVDAALCFLEVRPFFFRSGYMYKDILRKVKRAALTQQQGERLARIVSAYELYRSQRKHET